MNDESRDGRHEALDEFSRRESVFPGGEHATRNCTACTRVIVHRFGGEVRGYLHADNPTASVGEVEYGHDFAVTADGFLVDPWLFHYYVEEPVLDLDTDSGRDEALRRYGPCVNWILVPL